jgi:type IV pilus assembly protein PilB
MTAKNSKLIGELLVQKKLITVEQLEQALGEQKETGGLLGAILVKSGFIIEEKLYEALSEQFGTEYVKLKDIDIPHSAIEKVPAKFVTHYKLIPISFEGNTVTIATSDPMDIHTLDDLKLLLKKDIKTVLSTESDIIEAIKKYYGIGPEIRRGPRTP